MTRIQLDQVRCVNGCDDHPIDLSSKCHFNAPTFSAYDRKNGTLILTCAECGNTVLTVSVAEGIAAFA